MSLKSIVEDCCTKWSLNPAIHGLKLNKKDLDLNLSIRFANISSGAKLQLVARGIKKSEKVTVALQMEQDRLIETFNSSETLWDILRTFEAKHNIVLTSRTGIPPSPKKGIAKLFSISKEVYMMPVLIYMNREFSTIEDLKTNTLEMIGLTSNGILRLLFKFAEDIKQYKSQLKSQDDVSKRIVEPIQNDASNRIDDIQAELINCDVRSNVSESTSKITEQPIQQVSKEVEHPSIPNDQIPQHKRELETPFSQVEYAQVSKEIENSYTHIDQISTVDANAQEIETSYIQIDAKITTETNSTIEKSAQSDSMMDVDRSETEQHSDALIAGNESLSMEIVFYK